MPQRAGALRGSMTGTTTCLTDSAVQHNSGASARDGSKWLPGTWGAFSCSLALVLGSSLASLLSMSRSFPPEHPTCPTGTCGKNHWDRAECSDLVQRGTKMQVELSSYSKATNTSISKCQLQPHTAFPASDCHRSYNPSPRRARLCPRLVYVQLNVPEHPWDADQRKRTSWSAPHFTQLWSLAEFCWYPQHSSSKLLRCHALTPTAAAFVIARGLSSSDLAPAPLCDLPTPFHRLAQCQAPPPPMSLSPSVRVLAFSSTQLMHQGHSCSAPEPRAFHPPDPPTKGSPRGSEPVTKQFWIRCSLRPLIFP